LFLGILSLPEKIVSFATNAPQAFEVTSDALWGYERFAGQFSSDPRSWTENNLLSDDSAQADTGDIQLALEYVGDGRYVGEIHSTHMAVHTFAQWSRVTVNGEMNVFGKVDAVMWDFVGGGRRSLASFSLSIEDPVTGTLRLTPNEGRAFQGDVILWPTTFTMTGGVRGKKFEEALRETIQRNRDPNGPMRQPIGRLSETGPENAADDQ